MSGRQRRPGDPYEVGYAKPPKKTQFKKGLSGNPNGRPPKKPDLYTELSRVLRESVTVTIEGEQQRVTVQQALLLRLRDEALQGQVWASRLLQKVLDAMPDSGGHFEMELDYSEMIAKFDRASEESDREKANNNPEPTEAGNGE